MSPVQGFSRYRSHNIGKQTVLNTPVAATRRTPFRGAIVVDPQLEDPDVDTATLDPVLPPVRKGLEVTGSWETDALSYNDALSLWLLALRGGESPVATGTAQDWDINPSSDSVDTYEMVTDEWYDDVATDTIRAYGGIITDLTITYPDDLGPLTASASLTYAGADVGSPVTPTAPTTGFTIDGSPIYIYAADTSFRINDTAATIGLTQIQDTFHGGNIHVTTEIEKKRFANGSNNRFAVAGYGRVSRSITAEFRFAKTSTAVTEVANWLNSSPVKRYIDVATTSPSTIGVTGLPYIHRVSLAGHWMTRTDDQIGGNDIIVLSMNAKHDLTLLYPIRVQLRNRMAAVATPT